MADVLAWLAALLLGAALGLFFFLGLWWTVRRAMASTRPALWFASSLLARMAVTLAGIYLVVGGQWQRLLACLLGLWLARLLVLRLTPAALPPARAGELGDAP